MRFHRQKNMHFRDKKEMNICTVKLPAKIYVIFLYSMPFVSALQDDLNRLFRWI